MLRPKLALGFLFAPALLLSLIVVSGCSGAAEQPALRQFFQASALRDNVTLGNIATTTFDPMKDGRVENFSITTVTPEQATPLHIKEFAAEQKAAQDADAEYLKKKKAFQDEHIEVIDRIIKGTKGKAGKGDAEVQANWTKMLEEGQAIEKRKSEARAKMSAERPVAELSMTNLQNPVDVTAMDGVLVSKDVTLNATVRTPSGQSVKKTLVVTMQQAKMKDASGKEINGKWIVTKFKDQGAGAGTTS